ncbi:MAG: LysM peptidoglycan-binding domain-containing protein [Bacteroidota bacterium]
MKRLAVVCLLCFLFPFSPTLFSQTKPKPATTPQQSPKASEQTKGSNFAEWSEEAEIQEQLDEFMRTYRYQKPTSSVYDTLLQNTRSFKPKDIPRYTPNVIQRRMYAMPTVIRMDYNQYVQRYIEVYSVRRRDQVSRMLGLSKVYFPIFEEYLDRYQLPMEIKYLSVVESALNPHARSRVGATGLWQFMLMTGKQYGLQVNSFVDERKDPYKATEAAVHYLKDAYAEFGDWLLAIASYNCGIGNVRKAIRRSGGKKTFWEIRDWLPRETRGYVPAFIAASYVFEHAADHNLYPVYVNFSLQQDTLQLRRMDITLDEIARMTRADINELRNLNPELKLERIPFTDKPYVLRVPTGVANYFASHEAAIRAQYGKRRDQYIAPTYNSKQVATSNKSGSYNPQRPRSAGPPAGSQLVYYTVRSGDVVGTIAERFHVSPRQIANWNNLRRYRIKAGQKLRIYAKKSVAQQYKAGKLSTPAAKPKVPTNYTVNKGQGTYYTIKSGDTLWGIANTYGVSVDQIKKLNYGLKASNLKPGQSVRVK